MTSDKLDLIQSVRRGDIVRLRLVFITGNMFTWIVFCCFARSVIWSNNERSNWTFEIDGIQRLCETTFVQRSSFTLTHRFHSFRYYACLCGHLEIVQYLLERGKIFAFWLCFRRTERKKVSSRWMIRSEGARCQANTFDGERCQYGALTDTIRALLKNYQVLTTRTIKRNTFDEFLRK